MTKRSFHQEDITITHLRTTYNITNIHLKTELGNVLSKPDSIKRSRQFDNNNYGLSIMDRKIRQKIKEEIET